MPDFEPSLDEIRRTDSFIDALATGRPAAPQDPADAALAALLGGWRDEMRWPPETGLISEPQAIAALNAGLAEKPRGLRRDKSTRPDSAGSPGRSRRGLSVVGAVAAAALCIGGFGAVVSGAGPGDSLYGLRTMLFGAPKQVRDDQVALAARTELSQVQELISQGDWEQAQQKLVAVSTQVAAVGDEEQKQQLLDQFNDLSAKVVERDPQATAPPGIVYTVEPSATELVPAPAPVTSSTSSPSSSPTAADSSTPATSSEPVSTSPASTSPVSTSPASTSPAASSAAPSTAAATTPTTTPTSAAPTASSTASSTSAAPKPSTSTASSVAAEATSAPSSVVSATSVVPKSATTSAPATTAPSATTAAPVTTTAAAQTPAQTTVAQTTVAQTTVAQTTVAPATAAPVEEPKSAVVTTTVVIPVPAG